MKLNNFTDYSLRVLIFLSTQKAQKATVTQIAESYDISQNHLVKVVHNLAMLKLIDSFKGRGGGLVLKEETLKVKLGNLIMDLEGDAGIVECFNNNDQCKIESACKLKSILARAKGEFYSVLNEYTLLDITKNQKKLAHLLLGSA